jgi:hypothetical protein
VAVKAVKGAARMAGGFVFPKLEQVAGSGRKRQVWMGLAVASFGSTGVGVGRCGAPWCATVRHGAVRGGFDLRKWGGDGALRCAVVKGYGLKAVAKKGRIKETKKRD